tara:strand:+ start:5647 stop:5844 length:198 start_codon:yes stop_codon:yes gene_type:complete
MQLTKRKNSDITWNELLLDLESTMSKYQQALKIISKASSNSHELYHLKNIAKKALEEQPTNKELF